MINPLSHGLLLSSHSKNPWSLEASATPSPVLSEASKASTKKRASPMMFHPPGAPLEIYGTRTCPRWEKTDWTMKSKVFRVVSPVRTNMLLPWEIMTNHRMIVGLRENLQENPMLDGKNHGFTVSVFP